MERHRFTLAVAAVATAFAALHGYATAADVEERAAIPVVSARVETAPIRHSGDAADDAAIWVDPRHPSRSVLVATDKRGGLAVYDLAGRELHYYADSEPNNVDLRDGFRVGQRRVAVVATSDRRTDTIRVYVVDPATRGLVYAARRPLSTGIGVAGLCMYLDKRGQLFVFVGDSSGTIQQWQLVAAGDAIDARKVRTLRISSTTEGCVADDGLGRLYVSEEDVGIWRFDADPTATTGGVLVDSVGAGRLTADIEGLALYQGARTGGYLLASSQGSDSFVMYERAGANAYVGRFRVGDGAVDGVTHTDGIDATSRALGPMFPRGVFVAQDDDNEGGNQNFKLVPWDRIRESIKARPRGASGGEAGPASAGPATYHVDSRGGDDASAGTSPRLAWRTLARVGGARLEPGDAVLLARGAAWREPLEIAFDGRAGSRIVVGAYGRGPRPVVEGSSTCVALRGSYVTVRGLHVRDCEWAGIEVRGRSDRIEANVVSGSAAGVYVRREAAGTTIVGNEIRDNSRMSRLTPSPDDDDSGAFGIVVHGESTEIAFNVISGSDAFSYDYGRDGAAIEIYGARSTFAHHNLAVDNDAFAELGNRASDTRFVFNVVRSSLPTSVFLVTRGAGSRRGPVLGTALYHNTASLTGRQSKGVVCHGGCGGQILVMRNNIVAAAEPLYADQQFDEDFNLFAGSRAKVALGAHSLFADPAFRDSPGDLRLEARSPAVDRGEARLGYSRDFTRARVPADGDGDGTPEPDLGAYELQASRR